MNTIFEFTDRTSVYSKCIFASICHAVMVGKYTLLSDEISWDGTNFLFQNMEDKSRERIMGYFKALKELQE